MTLDIPESSFADIRLLYIYRTRYKSRRTILSAQCVADGRVAPAEGSYSSVSPVFWLGLWSSGQLRSYHGRLSKCGAFVNFVLVSTTNMHRSSSRKYESEHDRAGWGSISRFPSMGPSVCRWKRTIRLFPSTSSTEAETNPCGPRPALEQKN